LCAARAEAGKNAAMPSRPHPWLIVLFAAVLAAALVGAWYGGLGWDTLASHAAMLRRWVAEAPLAAAALYCAAYAASVALSLPFSLPFTLVGGMLFGVVLGSVLAVGASSTGAVLLFLLARGALAPLVARRAAPFLERVRPGLQRDGFSYLLALRLIPAVPFWLLNLAPALVGMRLLPYAAATVLGVAPIVVVLAGIGAGLAGVLARGVRPDLSVLHAPSVLLPLAGLAALSLLPVAWRHMRRMRRA
jgi:uncharacterized membrane protein YdjX (TVP38/TMEM64 family)